MSETALIEAGNLSFWEGWINGWSLLGSFYSLFLVTITGVFAVVICAILRIIIEKIVSVVKGRFVEIPENIAITLALGIFMVVFILAIGLYGRIGLFTPGDPTSGKVLEEWKEELVLPYIEGMDTERVEIEAAKRRDYVVGNYYSPHEGTDVIPVSVIYTSSSSSKAKTLEADAIILYDLEKNDTPYMEFKEFKQHIGHGYRKGKFDVTLHLPKGYYFNQ